MQPMTRYVKPVCLYTFFIIMLIPGTLRAITFVYNLRIGETTRARNPAVGDAKPSVAAFTAIGQFRGYETDFHQSAGGVLGTYIHAQESWYARVNAAVGRVHAHRAHLVEFSKAEFDDLLITGGYGWGVTERFRITLSGHLGLPLHADHFAELVQLGTGHIGLGAQIDAAYSYSETQLLLAAARIIHFFPRDIAVTTPAVTQLINDFDLGNAVDLLFAYQQNFKVQHMISLGYNPTFTFGTDDISTATRNDHVSTITNTLFATYRYAFPIKDKLSAIILGFSYGFIKIPAPLNHGNSTTAWFTWGINF